MQMCFLLMIAYLNLCFPCTKKREMVQFTKWQWHWRWKERSSMMSFNWLHSLFGVNVSFHICWWQVGCARTATQAWWNVEIGEDKFEFECPFKIGDVACSIIIEICMPFALLKGSNVRTVFAPILSFDIATWGKVLREPTRCLIFHRHSFKARTTFWMMTIHIALIERMVS